MSDVLHVLTQTDLVRWLVVAELLTLLWCSAFLHGRHHRPWELLSVVAVLAVAVVVNALIGPLPTPGVFVVAIGSLPATVSEVRHTVCTLAAARQAKRTWTHESGEFLALVDRLKHAEPCPDPTCVEARAELADIARRLRA